MATILDKDLVRESTVKIDGREVLVTLTDKQTISMKLKGMKSGEVEISIEDLFKQLKGEAPSKKVEDDKPEVKYTGGVDLSSYKGQDRYLISLNDIRHFINVKPIDVKMKQTFDGLLVDLINERKPTKK
jgi:hypothetical protein